MNTANILGSHLNPQQSRLLGSPPSARKRWIWSQQEDHLQLLAAKATSDAIAGKPVIVWYDEEASLDELFRHYPFYILENAVYCPGRYNNAMESALQKHVTEPGIHHIE